MCFVAVVYQWFYPAGDVDPSAQTGQCMGRARAPVCFVEVLCQSVPSSVQWIPILRTKQD